MAVVPEAPHIDINADAGLIQARLILDRIYQEEHVAVAPKAAE